MQPNKDHQEGDASVLWEKHVLLRVHQIVTCFSEVLLQANTVLCTCSDSSMAMSGVSERIRKGYLLEYLQVRQQR